MTRSPSFCVSHLARRTALFVIALACVVLAAADRGSSASSGPALVVEQGGVLYAFAADGSRRVRLVKTSLPGRDAAVSPDGSTVAFAWKGGISTMRLDGSHRTIVTRGDDRSPAWAPNGRTIYFVRSQDRFGRAGPIFGGSRTRPQRGTRTSTRLHRRTGVGLRSPIGTPVRAAPRALVYA